MGKRMMTELRETWPLRRELTEHTISNQYVAVAGEGRWRYLQAREKRENTWWVIVTEGMLCTQCIYLVKKSTRLIPG